MFRAQGSNAQSDVMLKVGLAAMSAIVQRSGGTQTHPAEELDSKLEVNMSFLLICIVRISITLLVQVREVEC